MNFHLPCTQFEKKEFLDLSDLNSFCMHHGKENNNTQTPAAANTNHCAPQPSSTQTHQPPTTSTIGRRRPTTTASTNNDDFTPASSITAIAQQLREPNYCESPTTTRVQLLRELFHGLHLSHCQEHQMDTQYKVTSAIAHEKFFKFTDKQGGKVIPRDVTNIVISSPVSIIPKNKCDVHVGPVLFQ